MAEIHYVDHETGKKFKLAGSGKMPSRLYLNKKQVRHVIGVSDSTLNNWIMRREIPYYKVGKRVLFDVRDIIKFMENFRVPAKK